MLLLGLHVGGGTRVGGHVHWNNQKYLKVVKTSTNVLHHFALEPLYMAFIKSKITELMNLAIAIKS